MRGAKVQINKPHDISPLLGPGSKRRIREIVGVYQARALNYLVLISLSDIRYEQTQVTKLVKYYVTYSNHTLRFTASDMTLRNFSGASYFSVSKSCSRTVGYFTYPVLCLLILQKTLLNLLSAQT